MIGLPVHLLTAAISALLFQCARCWPDWGFDIFPSTPQQRKHATEELTADTFDPWLKEHQVTAVLFYAPWCFYSQQVMGPWETVGQKLEIHDPPVSVVRIDADRHKSVGDKYGVTAFPTLKLFIDGAIFEYDQHGRSWQQIVKWVNNHLDRDHLLRNADDAENYLHDNDLNVVGLFPDGFNSSSFATSARMFDDVMFAEARGTEIAKEVAAHLAKHASLRCETIDVGLSGSSTKKVVCTTTGWDVLRGGSQKPSAA